MLPPWQLCLCLRGQVHGPRLLQGGHTLASHLSKARLTAALAKWRFAFSIAGSWGRKVRLHCLSYIVYLQRTWGWGNVTRMVALIMRAEDFAPVPLLLLGFCLSDDRRLAGVDGASIDLL